MVVEGNCRTLVYRTVESRKIQRYSRFYKSEQI